MKLILYSFLIVILISCSEGREAPDKQYVDGVIGLGFKKDISLHEAMDFMLSTGVEIQRVSPIVFFSSLPPDSIEFVRETLAAKPYFNYRDNAAVIWATGELVVKLYLKPFQKEALEEWYQTCDELKLTEAHLSNFTVIIFVTPGTEWDWVEQLSADARVEWVERDTYVTGDPFN